MSLFRRAHRPAWNPLTFRNRCRRRLLREPFRERGCHYAGSIAVTPVRMLSPRMIVVWPTVTPLTSVIAFSGPGGRMPTLIPASLARGRAAF